MFSRVCVCVCVCVCVEIKKEETVKLQHDMLPQGVIVQYECMHKEPLCALALCKKCECVK